ncbi:hypothetical protein NUSPORA_02649 [Nucleospora cyclopteri]
MFFFGDSSNYEDEIAKINSAIDLLVNKEYKSDLMEIYLNKISKKYQFRFFLKLTQAIDEITEISQNGHLITFGKNKSQFIELLEKDEDTLKKIAKENKTLFYLILKEIKIDSEEKKHIFNAILNLVKTPEKDCFVSLCIKKVEMEKLNIKITEKQLGMLINEMDDFEFYKYALIHGINVKQTNTFNYLCYAAIKEYNEDNETKLIIRVILKTADFQIIKMLFSQLKNQNYSDFLPEKYKILKKLLMGNEEIKEENIRFLLKNYRENDSLLNLKMLISSLIATGNCRNLILSLFLLHENKSMFEGTFEFLLYELFICRFFCFHTEISKLFSELEIVNIQKYNMAFIWMDPLIYRGVTDNTFNRNQCHDLYCASINDSSTLQGFISDFLQQNLFSHAFSCLRLLRNLKTNKSVEEFLNRKFCCVETETCFSNLLGPQCSFLFNKITKQPKNGLVTIPGRSNLITLKGIYSFESRLEMFQNDYLPIKNLKFINYVEEAIKKNYK